MLEATKKAHRKITESAHVLLRDPNDAAANTAVGLYFCLVKCEFDRGLVHLARGADQRWKAIAERDIHSPRSAHDQAELGDAWWDLGEARSVEIEKTGARRRARHWYQMAVPQLPEGLEKSRAERRVAFKDKRSDADESRPLAKRTR